SLRTVMDVDLIPTSSLYKDNAEWSDVTPIYESAEERAAVRIKYDEEFRDCFGYLRAILQTNEKSERVMRLLDTCIQKNAANYTLWQYRRECLIALDSDLRKELRFLDEVILENPKNYQVWHHRRAIVDRLGDAKGEIAFSEEVLDDESKNYHAWQHRQWCVRRFELPAQPELDYSLKLIMEDPRNNSAWNYRYFILQRAGRLTDKTTIDTETNLALQLACKLPNNESVWNYLSGILADEGVDSRPEVLTAVRKVYDETEKDKRSFHLVAFVVDSLMEKMGKQKKDEREGATVVVESAEEAKKLLEELTSLDPVRTHYWNHQRMLVESQLQRALLTTAQ
ncbi:hypothetical protein PFISCL1PPCAC_16595, partial [Pristionchus fissidentatus]